MTLSARHRISYSLFSLSIITNVTLIALLIHHSDQLRLAPPLSLLFQKWWLAEGIITQWTYSFVMTPPLLLSSVTLIMALILFIFFYRSTSQEIFYLQLFLLCLSFFSIRDFSYLVHLYRLPFYYIKQISRGVIFFRFNSVLFLLLSGLSVFESRFQKSDAFFTAAVLASLCLSVTLPLSEKFIQNTLTYLPVNEFNLFLLFIVIQTIIPINFLWFFYQRKTADYLILTLSVIILVMAENLIFYMTMGGFILGLILIVLGSVLFSQRIHRLYLWR